MDVEERKLALSNFWKSTVQGREKKTEQGSVQAAARSKASNLFSTVDTGDSHSKDVLSKLSIPYENANRVYRAVVTFYFTGCFHCCY
jgi:hypothetical protein